MNYILDTHIFLWIITNNLDKMSNKQIDVIKNTENNLYLSSASIWEMMIKCSIKKLHIPNPQEVFIKKHLGILRANELTINISHSCEIINLPAIHRDPFDRMIIAQSIVEDYGIISNDQYFKDYDVNLLNNK